MPVELERSYNSRVFALHGSDLDLIPGIPYDPLEYHQEQLLNAEPIASPLAFLGGPGVPHKKIKQVLFI